MKRTIFIVSDGTGLTAEALGHSLLTQFPNITFDYMIFPYIDSIEKAEPIVQQIGQIFKETTYRPIIFTTLVKPEIREFLAKSSGIMVDFFMPFISLLEQEFQSPAKPHVGRAHGVIDDKAYKARMDAVNYALSCDDGLNQSHYRQADLILLGVSRSGKTPTCLYLAIEFGLFAANCPLTEEFFLNEKNVSNLLNLYRHKLFGLIIDEQRLHQIRSERKKGSVYASLACCQQELKAAYTFFRQENIPCINTTARSIEEIAISIITTMGIKKRTLE